MGLPQAACLKAVSHENISSLEKYSVFELVLTTSVLAGHRVVGTRWVLKVKADSTNSGRSVVQGLSQIPGVDCGGTFAPVCRLQIVRIMPAIAAELNYEVHMLNMQMTFLRHRRERVRQDRTRRRDQRQSRSSSRREAQNKPCTVFSRAGNIDSAR